MQTTPGIFIVLEGADGSGKGTQFKLLKERLRAVGYDVAVFDFPRYDQPSSYFVQRYLNGAYGSAVAMSPYTSSLFYALDRFEAAPEIKKALDEGKIVLSNRYVGSNMAHQGSKFSDNIEQRSFFIWEDNLEFGLLGIPRPTINIFLRVPADISYELIKRKAARSYTNRTHDELESDLQHLKNSVATYDTLCRLFPKDFKAVECSHDGELLEIPEINNLIWSEIKHLLPEKPPHAGRSVVVQLDEVATAPEKLEEPPAEEPRAEEPAQQPQPLITPMRAVTNGGNISFKLDSLSLYTAFLIKTTPGISIKLGKPWEVTKGRRPYYVPKELDVKEADNFRQKIDKIASNHKKLHGVLLNVLGSQKLAGKAGKLDTAELNRRTYDILRPAVPLAALVSAQVSGSVPIIENLIIRLISNRSKEAQAVAKIIQEACRKNYSKEFKDSAVLSLMPPAESSRLSREIIQAAERLPQNLAASGEELKLVEARPRNELSMLAEVMYPYSELPREEIEQEVEHWTYEHKEEALQSALKDGTAGSLLDMVQYRWDALSDWGSLEKLLAAGLPQDLQLQPPSPRFGFSTPPEIEEAALDDEYADCFDVSLGLYSDLQAAEHRAVASYATLLGHKIRWQATTDLPLLQNFVSGNSSLPLAKNMQEKVSEVHPLLSEYLSQAPAPKAAAQPQKASSANRKAAPAKKPTDQPAKKSSRNRRRGGKPKKT